MKKNIVKIVLDIIMTIILLLMYNKGVINLEFHEWGGLAVFGLFLIHKGLNWKWIVNVSKRLFRKELPTTVRLGYIIDVLLLVAMTSIIVSGLFMSKVVLPQLASHNMIWRQLHYFASAAALILVGIHLGLHWMFLRNMFLKLPQLPKILSRTIGYGTLAVVLVFGAYRIESSSFTKWLSGPFTTASFEGRDMGKLRSETGTPNSKVQQGEETQGEDSIQGGDGFQGGDNFRGGDSNGFRGERPDGMRHKDGGMKGSGLSLTRILEVIASYGSITVVFATITAGIHQFLRRRRKVHMSTEVLK